MSKCLVVTGHRLYLPRIFFLGGGGALFPEPFFRGGAPKMNFHIPKNLCLRRR